MITGICVHLRLTPHGEAGWRKIAATQVNCQKSCKCPKSGRDLFYDTLPHQFRILHAHGKAILVLHGPTNSLVREPEVYGSETLDEINHRLQSEAERAGATLSCLQSNGEQELVEAIHQARADGTQFIIINPAAFTHTSVAIRDALSAVDIPCIEVNISNV